MSGAEGTADHLAGTSEREVVAKTGHSHPDKTFIGHVERGFDFLGYHFGPEGLSLAKKTIEGFVARCIRLYEQEPEEASASARLGRYVRRWIRWAGAGLGRDDLKLRLIPGIQWVAPV